MNVRVIAVVCLAAGLAGTRIAPAAVAFEDTLTWGRFGTVWLYRQTPHPAQVVLFVSGDGGWNQGVVDMARDLAGLDALVVGVDIIPYLKRLEAASEPCSYPASDFESLSQFVQKHLDYPHYVTPMLVGYSSGATLVYGVLTQAPPATFRGAISLGFCPDLPLTKPMCPGSGLAWEPGPRGKGVSFLPASHLETPWIALQGTIDQVCDPAQTEAFVERTRGAEVVVLPKVGHGYSVPRNWLPQFEAAFAKILAAPTVDPTRAPVASPTEAADPADLPLIEVPATATASAHDALVVHLTGDGGWGVTDKGLAGEFAAAGVPVVGWNSLQYYWHRRDPDQAALDLARILRHYLAAWGKEQAILVGYSFGADVLPLIFNRLPADLQARVPGVVLLGPADRASFEFRVAGWLGLASSNDDYPVAPEIARIAGAKVFCFCGEDDKDAICDRLDPARVTTVVLTGGHRIGRHFDGIAAKVLAVLP